MPHHRCCVGCCHNDSRKPEEMCKRGHVDELKFHYMTKDPEKRKTWEANIRKGRPDFKATDHQVVCSNHFPYGAPTFNHPHPTLYLVESDRQRKSPCLRKRRKLIQNPNPNVQPAGTCSNQALALNQQENLVAVKSERLPGPCLSFEQLTRDCDVKLFTGFKNAEMFRLVFEFLYPNAVTMKYWQGSKRSTATTMGERNVERHYVHGNRKLKLEEEFFMVMQRMRLGLLTEYLAIVFNVSPSVVSSVFFSWIRLMALELRFLISWPDRIQVLRNMPDHFRKYYNKCRVVIDCTEFYIETPSSLEMQSLCWSEYKHHCTIKLLVGITPNGSFSFISDTYGGRASDKFIIEDSGFLKVLQPGDQVMTDRGFQIEDVLAFYQCRPATPPISSFYIANVER